MVVEMDGWGGTDAEGGVDADECADALEVDVSVASGVVQEEYTSVRRARGPDEWVEGEVYRVWRWVVEEIDFFVQCAE